MQKKKSHVSFDDLVVVVESTGDVSTWKMTTSISSGNVSSSSQPSALPVRPDTPFHEPKILSPKCSLSQARVHVQLGSACPEQTHFGHDRNDRSFDEHGVSVSTSVPQDSEVKSQASSTPVQAQNRTYDQPDVVLHTQPTVSRNSQPNLLQAQGSRSLPPLPSCKPDVSAVASDRSSPVVTVRAERPPEEAEESCVKGENGSEPDDLEFLESEEEELLHLGDDFLLDYMVLISLLPRLKQTPVSCRFCFRKGGKTLLQGVQTYFILFIGLCTGCFKGRGVRGKEGVVQSNECG